MECKKELPILDLEKTNNFISGFTNTMYNREKVNEISWILRRYVCIIKFR